MASRMANIVDDSTVAVVGALATAAIGYMQYHYGNQAAVSIVAVEGRLTSLETKVDTMDKSMDTMSKSMDTMSKSMDKMSKSMVTKADLKADLKSPCPTAISGRYPR